MRILVVEDECRMAELLEQGLIEEGHSVTVALDGLSAFTLAQNCPFDLILLDLMLPGAWAICLDIGKKYGGTVSGAMNTAGNIGGFFCASVFGYLVEATGNYNFPLYVIAGMLLTSAGLFSLLDPGKKLVEETG